MEREADTKTAEEQARFIFYKIGALVFDAVRQELAAITLPLIQEQLAQTQKIPAPEEAISPAPADDQAGASAPTAPLQQDNHQDPYLAIRALIASYVEEQLEAQAPQIIAKILTHAFQAPNSPPPSS